MIVSTEAPAAFLGFVLLVGGRRRLPEEHVFRNRLRSLRDRYHTGAVDLAEALLHICSWIAHARHADTGRLREAIFRDAVFARRGGLTGPLPRCPRRLLEQQPTEPARGQPQRQHAGQPKQQYRLPGCQDTPPPEPASPRRSRVRKGVSRTGHDEVPPVGGESGVRLGWQRRRTPPLRGTSVPGVS
jgi:hypothetical protein